MSGNEGGGAREMGGVSEKKLQEFQQVNMNETEKHYRLLKVFVRLADVRVSSYSSLQPGSVPRTPASIIPLVPSSPAESRDATILHRVPRLDDSFIRNNSDLHRGFAAGEEEEEKETK